MALHEPVGPSVMLEANTEALTRCCCHVLEPLSLQNREPNKLLLFINRLGRCCRSWAVEERCWTSHGEQTSKQHPSMVPASLPASASLVDGL